MNKGQKKDNYIRRSARRGVSPRNTLGATKNGVNATNVAKKSKKGHYKIAFNKTFENVTDLDIELRKVYAKDLIADYLHIPTDMIMLDPKNKGTEQSLSSLDETFYVRKGKEICGKLSIRTQRMIKGNILFFIFQTKGSRANSKQKNFSRNIGFSKLTKGRKNHLNRKSYNKRRQKRY